MITEDQSQVISFLASPSTHDGVSVERIDTHSAVVFLAGDLAFKLKRAVRYDYLDFSTADRRRAMCEAEVRLNRRTAPEIYRGVVAITREPDGTLALAGAGTPVDWGVEMRRFPQQALFDQLAANGRLDRDLMLPLASAIARFHAGAEHRSDHGGRAGMEWVIDGNVEGFADYGDGVLDAESCRRLAERSRGALEILGQRLDQRRAAGFVRQCHGDVHLRNIVLLDGRPTLFDGVEFDDRIACIDVLYDLAFLLMDLWRRRLASHANAVWNGYLAETGDLDGVSLLPLFLSCRAAVRAKTSVTAARLQSDAGRRRELEDVGREYLSMAQRLLRPPPPSLVAIGGFSGTGKSTLALALAPSIGAVPGAIVLRSDEIRKRLGGVSSLQRLGPDGYSAEMSARVYGAMGELAAAAVRQGHSAIVDAVFARPSDRDAIETVATRAGIPFAGVWLDAPETVLVERSAQRRNDASDADADAEVVRLQQRQPTGMVSWHRVDASATAAAVLEYARGFVAGRVAGGLDASGEGVSSRPAQDAGSVPWGSSAIIPPGSLRR